MTTETAPLLADVKVGDWVVVERVRYRNGRSVGWRMDRGRILTVNATEQDRLQVYGSGWFRRDSGLSVVSPASRRIRLPTDDERDAQIAANEVQRQQWAAQEAEESAWESLRDLGMTAAEAQHRLATWESLRDALRTVALAGGNLSDENLESRTGPNDAAHRGLMVTFARKVAKEALAAAETRP
jgi:hypothetical protein